MTTKIEKLDNNQVRVEIELEPKLVESEYNKACSRISQKLNVPGFRPGKAPKNIVEKNVGVEYIQKEVLDALLPNILSELIVKNKFEMIAEPALEAYEFKADAPTKVVIKLELKPEVTLGEYKKLTIEAEKFSNDKGALQKELDNLAQRFSTFEKVEEQRPTNDKDIVLIDFEGTSNGELIKGGAAKNYTLDLGNSNFIPGFAEAIVGKEPGKEFKIKVNFPENYHDEKLKGQPAEFKITIHEIKKKALPEINDELAKKAGKFSSLDELKADIQKYLDNVEKQENDKRAVAAIFEKVVAAAKVDIQESMISREAAAMMEDFKHRIESQGGDFDKALQAEGKDKIWNQLKEDAVQRIKNSLVISKIAENEKLEVTPEDFTAKIAELAAMYGTNQETIIKEVQKNPALINQLSQQALNQKVTDFLKSNNTVSFVEKKKK